MGAGAAGSRASRSRVQSIYLHVDLDVLDAGEARANEYSAPGGPDLDRVIGCLERLGEQFAIAGAAITAYDPAYDPEGKTLYAARRIAAAIAACARQVTRS